MKKTTVLLASIFISSGLLTACGGSGSMGSGSDAKYLKANRGAAGAHISDAEAKQYARQQRLTAREIELENMKRRQTTDAVNETAGAVNSAAGALHSIDSLRNLF